MLRRFRGRDGSSSCRCSRRRVATFGPPRAGATEVRGVVAGDAHTVRIRPVLATVPAAPKRRATASARSAATVALTACDPARPTAVRSAPDASAHQDPTGTCVVSQSHPASRLHDRYLLGPAAFGGSDVTTVTVKKRARNEYALEMTFDASHAQALDDFAAAHFQGQPVAVTLDGTTVANFVLGRGEPSFTGMHGALWFEPAAGFSAATARELRATFTQARQEQLVGLVRATTMTHAAREIIASVNSSVDDKSQFADDCPVREVPDTVVLGCFGGGRLRVLRVDRPDLAPVMTVSMAHEMLHGAYEQLNRKERRAIDTELDRVYDSLSDPQLTKLVDSYATIEPGQRHTELHSLLATQVGTLSPRLERYYRRWFADRQQVVAAFQSYNGVLTALEQRHDELQAQLDAINPQIDDLRARAEDAARRSEDLAGQIEALRTQGRISESNDLVGPQNSAASEANELATQVNALADQYNAVVAEYNRLVESANQIYDSITMRGDDAPTS